jgi:hypothetical protein
MPSLGDAIALLVGAGVLVYLTWTLLFPERL